MAPPVAMTARATGSAPADLPPPPRLRERYQQEVLPVLVKKFKYSTPMQAPTLTKITLNMGVGEAKQNNKLLEAAQEQLAVLGRQREAGLGDGQRREQPRVLEAASQAAAGAHSCRVGRDVAAIENDSVAFSVM